MQTVEQAVPAEARSAEVAGLDAPVFGRRNLIVAGVLFVVALLSLFGLQNLLHLPITGVSRYPHFLYQAESLLHGRWNLDLTAKTDDIIIVHGKAYIVYPPMPAILLMPFVAIWGLATSDILFTAIFSACNLSLLYLLFEQLRANGLTRRIWMEHVIIALLLYFGTINLFLSLGGRMWFTAHILCMTFTLLALLTAFRRHYVLSAVLLGCAFFCRATALFGFALLFYLVWQDARTQATVKALIALLRTRALTWRAVPWRLALPAVVAVVVLLLFMARNVAAFGSPLESGYNILIQQRTHGVTNGPFSLTYVPANIIANFFSFPHVIFSGPFDRNPKIDMLNQGYCVSVFVTTPLFLLLFMRNRRFNPLRAALWATLGLVVIAVLLFHAAGWFQFGARYLFEGYPYAYLLLVLSDLRVDWRVGVLGMLGVIINLLGAMQFWLFH